MIEKPRDVHSESSRFSLYLYIWEKLIFTADGLACSRVPKTWFVFFQTYPIDSHALES